MEALAVITVPNVLSAAYNVLCAAWNEYGAVEERRSQCRLILQRCQDLMLEIVEQSKSGRLHDGALDNLRFLESACMAIHAAIQKLAGKSFTWRLLHQDSISQAIAEAEGAILTACTRFNIGAHLDSQRLQLELAQARDRDHSLLISHLRELSQSDQKILEALQQDGRHVLRLQELVIALTKHVQNLGPVTTVEPEKPTVEFVRTATSSLQRLSGPGQTVEIPHWSVTSLEVSFDRSEGNCIGRGGFGCIYKGEWHGLIVAVKEMHLEDARILDRRNLRAVRREIDIWSRLTHPHVLPFYCACLEATQPFMVTKLCTHGNALEFLRAYPQADRICMLHEISLGMNYLHMQSVIHADLKAANILIGDDGKALISDFGLSQFQDKVSSRTSVLANAEDSVDGSLRWMAPELLRGDGERPDKPSDVYSFAITAWELYTGRVPFATIPDRAVIVKVLENVERPARPPDLLNDLLWEIMENCWEAVPARRPTFDAVQLRLRPLTVRSNSSFVVPTIYAALPSTPSNVRSFQPLNPGLLSPLQPQAIPPVPPSPLPPINGLTLSPIEDSSRSITPGATDPAIGLHSLLHELDTEHGAEKIRTVLKLEQYTHTDDGRAAMAAIPEIFPHFEKLLNDGSSDVKEHTTACLMNLAWDEPGKSAILEHPELVPPIIEFLWHGSSNAKENAARLLNRLAVTERGQKICLEQQRILPALANLMQPWSSPKEKEQSAKCFACLSCSDAGQKTIIGQNDLLPNLINVFFHGSSDAKQNVARCLANLATTSDGQTALLGRPILLPSLGKLIVPGIPVYETEQAIRCLQYLAYSSEGQPLILMHPEILMSIADLLSHESATVRKHAAACCRNLCQSLNGANLIFCQRSLPYNLKTLLLSAPPDTKEYAVATYIRLMQHSLNGLVPLDNVPVRHDRQCFLLAVEDLLWNSTTQYMSVTCLRRLCSENSNPMSISWSDDINDRPNIILSLAKLTTGDARTQSEAAQCLAILSRRAKAKPLDSYTSQHALSALANALSIGHSDTRKYVADCLVNLTSTSRGVQAVRQHSQIILALREVTLSQYTHPDIKAQASLCLQYVKDGPSSKRSSILFRWAKR